MDFSLHQGKDNKKAPYTYIIKYYLFSCLFVTCLFVLSIKADFAAHYYWLRCVSLYICSFVAQLPTLEVWLPLEPSNRASVRFSANITHCPLVFTFMKINLISLCTLLVLYNLILPEHAKDQTASKGQWPSRPSCVSLFTAFSLHTWLCNRTKTGRVTHPNHHLKGGQAFPPLCCFSRSLLMLNFSEKCVFLALSEALLLSGTCSSDG